MPSFDTPLPTSSQFIITEADTVTAAWERFECRKRRLDAFIEKLIDRRDRMDGDHDVELNGDENDDPGDCGDAAWIEWMTMRGAAKCGPNAYGPQGGFGPGIGEDTEEDDAPEEDDGGGDVTDDDPGFDPLSRIHANWLNGDEGAGCTINGDREPNGDELDYSEGY